MSKFQIGDKVKFLNQIGGGVVTKITDDFVFVQDETGFDMPMQATELIRMADMNGAGKMFNQRVSGGSQQSVDDETEKVFTPKKPDSVESLQETVKQLQSQVANLKDQVNKLKRQLAAAQKQGAKELAGNVLLQHMVADGEAEVDLHIDMLCENPGELAPHEAFQTQMRYFRTCLNHAFENHLKKVTFIHGVGRGILRDEIMAELKKYDDIAVMDAPMRKYGVGAVEVYFK
ncbi:MAG: Smr/MutS family protein [Bacteroidales bacterium]|nr:Smr/MutS family protein [Bacteroidales bacterium]